MTGRLYASKLSAIDSLDVSQAAPRRVGILAAHDSGLIEAEGLAEPSGSTVRIMLPTGSKVRGEVVGFRASRSLIVPFASNVSWHRGLRVEPFNKADVVACGFALLGRVIDACGDPLDGRGPIVSRLRWPLAGRRSNPLDRSRVTQPFDVGVRSINALLTLGRGQRVALVAGSGVGKTVLLGEMLAGAECDIFVIALVGERSREVTDFIETKLPPSVRRRAVVVAVSADRAPQLRLRAALRATAIAEQFRSAGKHVFLLVDSLTRVAHAQREIGLALGEPPTTKGYPPSALSLVPQLIERAGSDRFSGGSITGAYTVLADGGDTEDPIVDAARAVADGHILLSRSLAEKGIYPAIDITASLSRTMSEVVDDEHRQAAANFRRLWSTYMENRDLIFMGAYVPGHDAWLDRAIAEHDAMVQFLVQAAHERVDLDSARSALTESWAR